jgi:hypothetical protein
MFRKLGSYTQNIPAYGTGGTEYGYFLILHKSAVYQKAETIICSLLLSGAGKRGAGARIKSNEKSETTPQATPKYNR